MILKVELWRRQIKSNLKNIIKKQIPSKRVKEVTVKSCNIKTYRKSTCLATKSHKSEILKTVKTFLRTSSRAYPFGYHPTWQSMKTDVSFSTLEVSILSFIRLWQVKVSSLAAAFIGQFQNCAEVVSFWWPAFQSRNWV